MYSLRRKYFCF